VRGRDFARTKKEAACPGPTTSSLTVSLVELNGITKLMPSHQRATGEEHRPVIFYGSYAMSP
jgi:hypothetical protein